MQQFDYNKYLNNNPLLKEAKNVKKDGDEIWFSDANYFKKEHEGYKLKPTDMVAIGDSKAMTYAQAKKKFGGAMKENQETTEAADYSKVDSILAGTYKRPEKAVNPEIQKISQVLDKFVSKPFDYERLEDLLNALGPVKPQKLDKAISMMKIDSLDLSGENNFWNLVVYSNNYSDDSNGVALSWDGRKWNAG
jgi:hypothetical protein